MYYYQFNIGDYASHANNLSLLEDLAYRRLLDAYYRDEGLEETCEQEIARDIGMKDYQDEVSYVLKKFFKKTKKGYKQEKADREIKAYHAKADAARANGKLGGRPKKTQEKPSGLADKTESKANQEPITNNHKPKLTKPESVSDQVWLDFLGHRKKQKADLTQTALSRIEGEAAKAGWSLNDVLTECVTRGWRSFKAEWVANKKPEQEGINWE